MIKTHKIPEHEKITQKDLHKNPSLLVLCSFILGAYTYAIVGSLVDFDYFVDKMVSSEKNDKTEDNKLINVAKLPFANTYAFVKLWQQGIAQKLVDQMKTYEPGVLNTNYMYCLRFLTQLSRNRTLCEKLVKETDYVESLISILHQIIQKEEHKNRNLVQMKVVLTALKAASRSEASHDRILREISLLNEVVKYNNTQINANVADILSRLVTYSTHKPSFNQDLLNLATKLTQSHTPYTKNVSLYTCAILVANATNQKEVERKNITELNSYIQQYHYGAFASTLLTYATVGIFYGLARYSFRAIQLTGGLSSFPLKQIIKGALKTSLVAIGVGTSFTIIDYIQYYFDTKMSYATIEELKQKALTIEASVQAYNFLLPIFIIYLMHKVPFIIAPILLGRSMTTTQPFSIFMPDHSKKLQDYLRKNIQVERVPK